MIQNVKIMQQKSSPKQSKYRTARKEHSSHNDSFRDQLFSQFPKNQLRGDFALPDNCVASSEMLTHHSRGQAQSSFDTFKHLLNVLSIFN